MTQYIFVEATEGTLDDGTPYNNITLSNGLRACSVKNLTGKTGLKNLFKEGDEVKVVLEPSIVKGPNKTTQWAVVCTSIDKLK